MRILHLLASPFWSGPAEIVALLAQAQRALGHEVQVAVDRRRTDVPAEEPAVPRFEALGLLDDGGMELSVKSPPGAVLADLRKLRVRQVDVVHAHFSHDHLIARFARPKGAALIRSIHAPRSLRWSLPRADGYTVPSDVLLAKLPDRNAVVLPALIGDGFAPPEDRAALRRELGFSGAPLVGMISTFQPSRRHDVALEAFARVLRRHPDATLLLVGDGVLEPRLRAHVNELGIQARVHFAGYQTGPAFVRHLQSMDEVWVLGLGNDWSGRAAAQARACGVRVVAVDEGALSRYADALIPFATVEHLEAVALSGERRTLPVDAAAAVAEALVTFYARCQEGSR